MWPNADLVIFTEQVLMENFIFYAVLLPSCSSMKLSMTSSVYVKSVSWLNWRWLFPLNISWLSLFSLILKFSSRVKLSKDKCRSLELDSSVNRGLEPSWSSVSFSYCLEYFDRCLPLILGFPVNTQSHLLVEKSLLALPSDV